MHIFLLGLILQQGLDAQRADFFSRDQVPAQSNTSDTLSQKDSVIVKNAFLKIFNGKPGRAALYSLVIPGGGQIYNKKYWKAPIAWAIDGALIYNMVNQNSQFRSYQNKYIVALRNGDSNVLFYKENRDKFRKASEYSYLYLFVGHILTVMDAYVDRHLMEFDISPDLSYYHFFNQPGLALTIKIPLSAFDK